MSKTRKKFLFRGALVAGLVAVIVGAMLSPSFGGGSFLTKKKANKTFVKKSDANKQFLKTADAVKTATAFSTTLPGFSDSSTTDVDIPGATATVTAPGNATLVATFDAVSLCTATASGFNCPLKVTIDGQPANPVPDATGYVFDSTVQTANSASRALSLTVSKHVTAGAHTVKITAGGLTGITPVWTMRTWHLLVQSFPG